ncbi:MAG: sugar ABC transporter permease [Sphaerochaeta sp.]|nr:sugar ABC transporter permease [Sphaerochaeta sp.]
MYRNATLGRGSAKLPRLLFLLPVLVLFLLFFIYPFIFTLTTSFTKWRGIGSMTFNGVDNYVRMLKDPTFRLALKNNLVWALAQGFVQVPLAAIVAMVLLRKPRGWEFLRTVYFLPNVISTVAIAMMWTSMYNVQYGLINGLLTTVFNRPPINFLGNPDYALAAVIFQAVIYIGYFMIVILAAGMNIPQELYEAAEIDGASVFQQERFITLPMLRGTLVTTVTLAMAYGIRHFEATYLMTGGGPAYATTTMGIDLYLKMDALRYSDASTAGIMLIVFGSVMIIAIRKIFGNSDPMSDSAQ